MRIGTTYRVATTTSTVMTYYKMTTAMWCIMDHPTAIIVDHQAYHPRMWESALLLLFGVIILIQAAPLAPDATEKTTVTSNPTVTYNWLSANTTVSEIQFSVTTVSGNQTTVKADNYTGNNTTEKLTETNITTLNITLSLQGSGNASTITVTGATTEASNTSETGHTYPLTDSSDQLNTTQNETSTTSDQQTTQATPTDEPTTNATSPSESSTSEATDVSSGRPVNTTSAPGSEGMSTSLVSGSTTEASNTSATERTHLTTDDSFLPPVSTGITTPRSFELSSTSSHSSDSTQYATVTSVHEHTTGTDSVTQSFTTFPSSVKTQHHRPHTGRPSVVTTTPIHRPTFITTLATRTTTDDDDDDDDDDHNKDKNDDHDDDDDVGKHGDDDDDDDDHKISARDSDEDDDSDLDD
ncbi:uncharacterized protein DEA37_0009549 [Paragonimus westermani]|uniref:Uncharacterized protein n=1 Tax=Paragonimus westermani TaxID=34504 RepID=A0A5J4NZ03_9TREM|nr:uncharacterized protein DEA37_0009549 [Paragonimus westermani]